MTANLADIGRILNLKAERRGLPPAILMTDQDRLADPVTAVVGLPAGAAVIVRHRDGTAREALARRLLPVARARGIKLLIADDARLAYRLGADGLHLPEAKLRRLALWRLWARPGWLVTAAVHSAAGLRAAESAGATAALLSPVFPTESHPGARCLGPLRFAALVREAAIPVYGLGGMTPSRARLLVRSGAVGLAGISGFSD